MTVNYGMLWMVLECGVTCGSNTKMCTSTFCPFSFTKISSVQFTIPVLLSGKDLLLVEQFKSEILCEIESLNSDEYTNILEMMLHRVRFYATKM